jgi:hypothetical protein
MEANQSIIAARGETALVHRQRADESWMWMGGAYAEISVDQMHLIVFTAGRKMLANAYECGIAEEYAGFPREASRPGAARADFPLGGDARAL